MSASMSERLPCAAENPARGRITSLGIGGKMDSSATPKPTAGPPAIDMRCTNQPVISAMMPVPAVVHAVPLVEAAAEVMETMALIVTQSLFQMRVTMWHGNGD